MTGIWWLSYAGDEGPRGVCVIKACGFEAAVEKAQKLAVSPGGQVRGFELPDDDPEASAEIEKLGIDVHVSVEKLRELGYMTVAEVAAEEES